MFDPAKDQINRTKHDISLERAAELDGSIVVTDGRLEGEQRYRLYGLLDGKPHCLAAVLRNGVIRAISLRRAHLKEYRRYVS